MKKIIIIILLFIPLCAFTQNKSDFTGTWQIITQAGTPKGENIKPTYLLINDDGSYIWGIDSTQSDPMKSVTRGKWILTSDGDLKFTPENPDYKTSYYSPRGSIYEYTGYDNKGKKVPEIVLEMSFFIQKIKP